MIHCTLTQNKLRVEQDTDVLPFQYSNNINIQFIKDSAYENYVVTPYYAWVPTKSIPPRKLDAFALPLKDGVFTLPMNAFIKDGYLGIAFSLTDGNEVLQTDPVYLAVQSSVGSNTILSENDSWQLVVIDTVNSYIELNVNDKLQALIKEVAKLDENSAELQREVNELIDKVNKMLEDGDFIPEHKWENTFLHFKNPDGSWDNGVNLKGPSGVYFGNDTPPEDGEYNVWVLPDGTPDFEIYAEQVKTSDDSNVQIKLDNAIYVKDGILTDVLGNQYGLLEHKTLGIWEYYKYADGRLECISDFTQIDLVGTAFGPVFSQDYTFDASVFSYPVAFVGRPYVDIIVTANQAWLGRISTYEYRLIGARFMAHTSTAQTLTIRIKATGKWK